MEIFDNHFFSTYASTWYVLEMFTSSLVITNWLIQIVMIVISQIHWELSDLDLPICHNDVSFSILLLYMKWSANY